MGRYYKHYSPDEWAVKKLYDADEVEYIGHSCILGNPVYLVRKNGKYKFVFYDKHNQKTGSIKEEFYCAGDFETAGEVTHGDTAHNSS